VRRLLVLWDVDHTLINAGRSSGELYRKVFAELFGRDLEGVAPMAGRTDRAIVADTLARAGVADPGAHVGAFLDGLARNAPWLAAQVRLRGRVLPGAWPALTALAAAGGDGAPPAVQSVLTGNMRRLAEAKLGALGLTAALDMAVGAYGDDHEARADLVPVARSGAARAYGGEFGGSATVLIGDTPLDVQAAVTAGARAVGVATGQFGAAELAAAGADAVLPDLTDTAGLLAAILGGQPS
jgi:phosphoglycolate phosphatase-like HAD superfamily hydrolase